MSSQPLRGIRVIDSTQEIGELCSRLLADLGADVIKVEPPGGASSRSVPPFAENGASLSFAVRNTNKGNVTLDLTREAHRAVLDRMLAGADVWVENNAVELLAGLGLDHVELVQRHPQLVIVSITNFGLTGPYRDFVATNDVMVAMGGLLARSGVVGRPPLLPPGSLAYDTASTSAAFAALTALWQRRSTGRGQHIDLSTMQAVAQISDWSMVNFTQIRAAGGRYDEVRNGSGPVYSLYPCADGLVRLVVITTGQWRAMRAWLGEPEHLQDEHWDQLLARMSIQRDILDDLYIELFKDRTAAALAEEAQRRGIVLAPVLPPADALRTPHYVERGTFVDVEIAPGVRGPTASGFFEIDGERAGYRFRGAGLGEDNALEAFEGAARSGVESGTLPVPELPAPSLPFANLRVLDLGHGGVGVEISRLLGDYGADVIKVETHTYPDFIRTVTGGLMSPSFASSNRGKRSLGLNARTEHGLAMLHRLVRWADVFVENASTGTMHRMGLDYNTLHRLNPRLVMVSSQLMGSSGPWKDWIGYGPTARAAGGMTHLWNYPGGGAPPGSSAVHPDHFVGRMGAVGAIASLLGREEHGDAGAHVEIPQVEAVINLLGEAFLQEALRPGSVQPEGNRSERGAPWGVYPCAGEERWCVITVRDDTEWLRLRTVLDDPPWSRDPMFDTSKGRIAAADELDSRIAEWTATRTDYAVMVLLQSARVPAGIMSYPSDLAQNEHLVARNYARPIAQPDLGDILLEGPAFEATLISDVRISPAPRLAEHTREICHQILGLDDSEIDQLVAEGSLEIS